MGELIRSTRFVWDKNSRGFKLPTGGSDTAAEQFVRVPMSWVTKLQGMAGSVYRVALMICYQCAVSRNSRFIADARFLRRHNIQGKSFRRSLHALEKVGLISVRRRGTRPPEIALIDNCTANTAKTKRREIATGARNATSDDNLGGHASTG